MVTRRVVDVPIAKRQQHRATLAQTGTSLNGAEALARVLADLGVRRAFGVMGGAIAQFCGAMQRVGIEIIHARHETGAVFMAAEAHFASDEAVVVYTTTGPGASNAITGLVSAGWDGAKLIVVNGGTDVEHRERYAFQETRPESLDLRGWLGASTNYSQFTIDDAEQIAALGVELGAGLANHGGFLATVNFPLGVQAARVSPGDLPIEQPAPRTGVSASLVGRVYNRLRSGNFVIWVGFGARKASAAVREFAERTGAPVMASPRAKGVFPESHPQYLGVTGMFGGHASVERYLRTHPPEQILVLGSRLGQTTSCFDAGFAPRRGFVHVDVNRRVFGVAYPEAETFAVNAEIGALLTALNQLWVPSGEAARRALPGVRAPAELDEQDEDGLVDPRALMAAVQRVVIDRSDALVMSDVGNSFAWANSELRFEAPHRYRTTSGFAAMTASSSGVVGAAMAAGRAVVALVGDGAMLMGNEVSTAVPYGAPAKWIVLNDASYGMIRHGMEAIGMKPLATEIPPTDFAMLATALGATGLRVRRAEELDGVLREMLAIPGPVVVDVALDPRPAPPFGSRNKAISQGWE